MKSVFYSCLIVGLALVLTNCSKEGPEGPKGDAGPQGVAGPQGEVGNANVTQYNFGSHNFATSSPKNLYIPMSAADMDRSTFLVFILRESGNVYPIPGKGVNGTSTYRFFYFHSESNAVFSITRDSGAGEEYSSIRIVRIHAANVVNGRKLSNHPPVDFNNYYEVCAYYGLETDL